MSPNTSKLALKLIVGVTSAVVSVAASALTEKALTKALDAPETEFDVIEDEEPEEEDTQEAEK